MKRILLSSDEFGTEEFKYDTLQEAREGLERLKASCEKHYKEDGIVRTLFLAGEETVIGEEEHELLTGEE